MFEVLAPLVVVAVVRLVVVICNATNNICVYMQMLQHTCLQSWLLCSSCSILQKQAIRKETDRHWFQDRPPFLVRSPHLHAFAASSFQHPKLALLFGPAVPGHQLQGVSINEM